MFTLSTLYLSNIDSPILVDLNRFCLSVLYAPGVDAWTATVLLKLRLVRVVADAKQRGIGAERVFADVLMAQSAHKSVRSCFIHNLCWRAASFQHAFDWIAFWLRRSFYVHVYAYVYMCMFMCVCGSRTLS
jgi:hypothetical protein